VYALFTQLTLGSTYFYDNNNLISEGKGSV